MKTRLSRRVTLLMNVLLFNLAFNPCAVSYAVRVERSVDTWQPKHYLVNISLNDQLSEIDSATARIDILILKPTSLIDLDFGELTVDSVTLDAKTASFTHNDGSLRITLPQRTAA